VVLALAGFFFFFSYRRNPSRAREKHLRQKRLGRGDQGPTPPTETGKEPDGKTQQLRKRTEGNREPTTKDQDRRTRQEAEAKNCPTRTGTREKQPSKDRKPTKGLTKTTRSKARLKNHETEDKNTTDKRAT
jgi:hypothetical protein